MLRLLGLLWALFATHAASGYDAAENMTQALTVGHWKIVEIAAPRQILYRLASESTNDKNTTLVFDFLPMRDCEPTAAVMIIHRKAYSPDLDGGIVLLAYKVPGQSEAAEITNTIMQKGDTFAFFAFQRLTTSAIIQSGDKGNLAIWIPESGDGQVKRSPNTYFPLDGFSQAALKAGRLCKENL